MVQVAVPPSWMLIGEAESVITGFGTVVGAGARTKGGRHYALTSPTVVWQAWSLL